MTLNTSINSRPSKVGCGNAKLLDLDETNKYLGTLSAPEIIDWAVTTFGDGLYALTSAGVDSALMLDHLARAIKPVPVLHINTGFLPTETRSFMAELKNKYNLNLYEFGPTQDQIDDITKHELWEKDLTKYSEITKLDPLTRAVGTLGITALLVGVRADQTDNRATLGYVNIGNDGELRIHPFINWSADEVSNYIDNHNLPRNPLHKKGFGSAGDWQTTLPGQGRQGRKVMECGLNVTGGRPTRNPQKG